MTVKKDLFYISIVLSLLTGFALSVPLNSSVLTLPQVNGTLSKPGTWPPGLTFDDVPAKEDISLIISPHQNLPKHPAQINQDVKDLSALIRVVKASMKPDRSVAPRSQCWRQRYHYVEANACVKSSLNEQELFDVLNDLYRLIGNYGPADLLVDVLIDNTVAALLTLEFDDGSFV
ncbi:hypothetical protein ACLMJK_005602 [Lecanora helva]